MKLWLLKEREDLQLERPNPWHPRYGKAIAMVVRAETEEAARSVATTSKTAENGKLRDLNRKNLAGQGLDLGQYGGDPWLDPEWTTCVELTAEGAAEIIMAEVCES